MPSQILWTANITGNNVFRMSSVPVDDADWLDVDKISVEVYAV